MQKIPTVDASSMTQDECWAQGGSWMSTAHDCLLPPPST